jgi:hypothetical protein
MIKTGMRWVKHLACMGVESNAYNIFVGKPERRRPFGKPMHRLEANIKLDFKEIVFEVMDRIVLNHDRGQCCALVNAVMNLWVL